MLATLKESTNLQDEEIASSLLTFLQAIELADNLEIIGTSSPENSQRGGGFHYPEPATRNPEEVFIIRDHSKPEGVVGAFTEVSISEIIEKVTEFSKAQKFIDVINNIRPPIALHGITRIVGYYSNVNNWNKSKVGELRDRANGSYGLTGQPSLFQKNRLSAINAL